MKKILYFLVFILLFHLIFILSFSFTIKANHEDLEWVNPSTEADIQKNAYRGKIRLSQDEIIRLTADLHLQLAELKLWKLYLTCSALILAIVSWFVSKKIKTTNEKFEGITILLLTLFLWFNFYIFHLISNRYPGFSNSVSPIRIVVFTVILILQPALFWLAYRLNNQEIRLNLHRVKFISIIAFALVILSTIIAMVLGLGILMTPDLSGFTS